MSWQQSHPSVRVGCPGTGLLLAQLAHTSPYSIQSICGIPPVQHLEEECSWALIHCMITSQEKRPQELGLAWQWSVRGRHLCFSSGVRRAKRRKDGHVSDAFVFFLVTLDLWGLWKTPSFWELRNKETIFEGNSSQHFPPKFVFCVMRNIKVHVCGSRAAIFPSTN